jgi:hypothetical protein
MCGEASLAPHAFNTRHVFEDGTRQRSERSGTEDLLPVRERSQRISWREPDRRVERGPTGTH